MTMYTNNRLGVNKQIIAKGQLKGKRKTDQKQIDKKDEVDYDDPLLFIKLIHKRRKMQG